MKTQATVSQPSAVPGSPLLQVSGALLGIIAFNLIVTLLAKREGMSYKTPGVRGIKNAANTK
jgi:flagellar protein FliO/FliZ